MLRAVVVDDERLVRKGFISLIDWSAHGIAIVGDAADGQSALELLAAVEADLLFTDITMPHMSGFELIKEVRTRYPRMRSVVLTCHHEFDCVQEALRLGAIDYIVKTLLELENADEMIGRIVERIRWEEDRLAASPTGDSRRRISSSEALVFAPRAQSENGGELLRLPTVRRNAILEAGRWWLSPLVHPVRPGDVAREAADEWGGRWRVVLLTQVLDVSLQEAGQRLDDRLPELLFYSRVKPGELLRLEYRQLTRDPAPSAPSPLSSTGIGFAADRDPGLRWTLIGAEREAWFRTIEETRPQPEAIARYGVSLCEEWDGLLLRSSEAVQLREEIAGLRDWTDWAAWLTRFSDKAKSRMVELGLTREVMISLIRAVQFMRRYAGDKINQNDVAAHVSMSRSYFSQCFARFAGQSFGELLRGMRLERAKSLLLTTTIPVYEIASAAGFEDDKYFSKLFRDKVGKLPSEFRASEGITV